MSTTFANPVLPGFQPDPSICRVGDDYYLATSSFELFPGLPIHHSRDLVNWRLIGHALERPTQIDLSRTLSSKGIFAPTLRHHHGRFYLICTDVGGVGNFILHATHPAGPWSDPVLVPIDGIDPSLCFHNGFVFLTWSAPEQRGIMGAQIDPDTGRLLAAPALWWRGTGGKYPEGPHLYHRGGWYYLLISEGGTEAGHMITVARSRQPAGPYESAPCNPLLTHRSLDHPLQSTGHGDLVQVRDGSWWMVFLATRPLGYHPMHNLGRETCLAPVDWPEGGWPSVVTPLPLALPMPPGEPLPFDPAANPWVFRRTPPTALASATVSEAGCRLPCLPSTLDDVAPCALLARRQTAFDVIFAAEVRLEPGEPGDAAGLAVVMNERHHATILLTRGPDGLFIVVHQRVGELRAELARHRVEGEPAALRVRAQAQSYHFELAGQEGWSELAVVSTRHLSTELTGGFTGVLLGLHATSQGRTSRGTASFQRIDYSPLVARQTANF
jgi:alpha-N-arabinofuranosidase